MDLLLSLIHILEERGLLTRKVYAEVPPRVEYTLTELGYSLRPVLEALGTWGTGYQNILRQEGAFAANEVGEEPLSRR